MYKNLFFVLTILSFPIYSDEIKPTRISTGVAIFEMCNSGARISLNSIECENLKRKYESGAISESDVLKVLNDNRRAGPALAQDELTRRSIAFQKRSDSVIAQVQKDIKSDHEEKYKSQQESLTEKKKGELALQFKESCYKSDMLNTDCDKLVNGGNAHKFAFVSVEKMNEMAKEKYKSKSTGTKSVEIPTNGDVSVVVTDKSKSTIKTPTTVSQEESFSATLSGALSSEDMQKCSGKFGIDRQICVADLRTAKAREQAFGNNSIVNPVPVIERPVIAAPTVIDKKKSGTISLTTAPKPTIIVTEKSSSTIKTPTTISQEQSFSATLSGALSSEDMQKCSGKFGIDRQICVADLRTAKAREQAFGSESINKGHILEGPVVKGPTEKIEESAVVVAQSQVDKTPTNMLKLKCQEAEKLDVVRSVEKCIDNVNKDILELAKLDKKIEKENIDIHYKELVKAEKKECQKINKRVKRKECKKEVVSKARKSKKEELKLVDASFGIKERKIEKINDLYDSKLSVEIKNKCGRRPFGSRADRSEKAAYRKCKKETKQEFMTTFGDEINAKLAEVNSSDNETKLVAKECSKGLFNIVSNNFQECIDKQVLAAAEIEKEAERLKELALKEEKEKEENMREVANAQRQECDDLVEKELQDLLSNDQKNIIGRQFHVTSLKLANEVLKKKSNKKLSSLEELVKDTEKKIVADDENGLMKKKMLNFYRTHGKIDDANYIDSQLTSFKSSVYLAKGKRLNNENISAYILADSIKNESSSFTERDAAAAWLVSKIRKGKNFREGSKEGNLLNMSVQAYRNINLISDSKADSAKIVKEKLASSQESLDKDFKELKSSIEQKYQTQCGADYFESDCWSHDAFNKKLVNTFASISNGMSKIDVNNELKGSIDGNFKFDFVPDEFMK